MWVPAGLLQYLCILFVLMWFCIPLYVYVCSPVYVRIYYCVLLSCKQRSLGRYNSLADSGHEVCLLFCLFFFPACSEYVLLYVFLLHKIMYTFMQMCVCIVFRLHIVSVGVYSFTSAYVHVSQCLSISVRFLTLHVLLSGFL
jgi:hypothetical protein